MHTPTKSGEYRENSSDVFDQYCTSPSAGFDIHFDSISPQLSDEESTAV